MRSVHCFFLSLLAGSVLVGCAPRYVIKPAQAEALNLAGPAPDVVLLSVSGRCAPPCVSPRDNWDYLSSRGTVDRLAQAIVAGGYRVQVASYASHPAAQYRSPYLAAPQRGFEALLADFEQIDRTWLKAAKRPRIVLLAHSHGVVWSHLLTRRYAQVPFALQVDLDGICAAWGSDYGASMRAIPDPPEGLPTARAACEKVTVQGRGVALKDIVWPNVERSLEVQSKRVPSRPNAGGGMAVNYLFELSRNLRLDGSSAGIDHFVSLREDHGALTFSTSDAMKWVTAKTAVILQDWKAQDASIEVPATPQR